MNNIMRKEIVKVETRQEEHFSSSHDNENPGRTFSKESEFDATYASDCPPSHRWLCHCFSKPSWSSFYRLLVQFLLLEFHSNGNLELKLFWWRKYSSSYRATSVLFLILRSAFFRMRTKPDRRHHPLHVKRGTLRKNKYLGNVKNQISAVKRIIESSVPSFFCCHSFKIPVFCDDDAGARKPKFLLLTYVQYYPLLYYTCRGCWERKRHTMYDAYRYKIWVE